VGVGATGTREFQRSSAYRSKASSLVINPFGTADPFPPIVGRTEYAGNTNVSHTVPLPAGVAGELILILATFAGGETLASVTAPGFTVEILSGASSTIGDTFIVFKTADGNEGNSVNISSSANERAMSALVWRISEWESFEHETIREYGTDVDLPPLSPSWGTKDTLWIAFAGASSTIAKLLSYPAGLTNMRTAGGVGSGQPPSSGGEVKLGVATVNPGIFSFDRSANLGGTTLGIEPEAVTGFFGQFGLVVEANLTFIGQYEPAVFTGQFSLNGNADLTFIPFFFEIVNALFSLDAEASLSFTGTHIPPVFNSFFSLDGEAELDVSGVAEVFSEFDLTGEADLTMRGSYVPIGGGGVALYGVANLTFTGTHSIPDAEADFSLTAEADLDVTGTHVAPTFTGKFLLGAVASLSATGGFLSESFGAFSLTGEAHFGIWARVPLLPGTGSSVVGDRATPTKVWSREDAPTVQGQDDPTEVRR